MTGSPVSALRPLTADEELCVLRHAPMLLSRLLRQGLSVGDALALAHNVTLIYYALRAGEGELGSPGAVLGSMSLARIAACCERLEEMKREGDGR